MFVQIVGLLGSLLLCWWSVFIAWLQCLINSVVFNISLFGCCFLVVFMGCILVALVCFLWLDCCLFGDCI